MKTKIIILICLLGITFSTYCQKKVLFEQIAFEYYKDSILKNHQLKDQLTISLKAQEDYSYWNIDCLKEFKLSINDTAAAVVSAIGTEDLNIGNDKIFKIKKFKKSKPPMIFATTFLSFDFDKYITAIVENFEGKFYTYLFEMNREGKINKWCKGAVK